MAKRAIFDKKNILVTGGSGFIGSHLCDELMKRNKIICVDNFITSNEENIDHLLRNPDFIFIRHDISEPLDLESFPELDRFHVKFQGVQEIYNLACPMSPKHFDENKTATALANSVGVKNMLDIAVKYNAKFLQFSSSVVYGPRRQDIKYFREDYHGYVNPVGARACYDEGKRFAEALTVSYREKFDIDAKIARMFRTFGSRMKLDDGQMLPDFINNALDNKELEIHGDENFISSFCHISDIVQGVIHFMHSEEQGPLNFGSDIEYKIVDVAKKIIEMTGSHSKIVFREPLVFMRPQGLPDLTQVKEILGWFPIKLLEDGIQETIDYLKAKKHVIGLTDEIL